MQADNPHRSGPDSRRLAPEVDGDPDGQSGDSTQPPPGGASRVGDREERYGPVLLRRYRKDDGRALLLYRHAGEEGGGS